MEKKKYFNTGSRTIVLLFTGLMLAGMFAFQLDSSGNTAADLYSKSEFMVPMRDGVKLFTSVYTPKGEGPYPILMNRTPYGVNPYGKEAFPSSLGPSSFFMEDGYIFVYQDVRGTYMSEGEFINMRPLRAEREKSTAIDESTDTWDTIEWLLENIPGHNGKVGMWGISYPGFYAAAGMIDAHPALQAVSPQAPIADWFFDDFHHHGAFFLPHSFNFLASFGRPRPEPTTERNPSFDHGTPDGYSFFLGLGPLDRVNERKYGGNVAFWDTLAEHPNYDKFWQERNLLPHIRNLPEAVLTVGGWFDAEDLYGPLNIYRAAEKTKEAGYNGLVMGPWSHGLWARGNGDHLGNIYFGSDTSEYYQEFIEFPFFSRYLKGRETPDFPEAWMFETGNNEWRRFEEWPPPGNRKSFFLARASSLELNPPANAEPAWDEYLNDPFKPVPFTEEIDPGMTSEYMTDDQRFASRRPDVLTFSTPVLEEDLTLAGPILADLWVSTSGTAADWIVKLIDVFPGDQPDPPEINTKRKMGGYQMMVRSEVIRGRFRNGYEHPEPFEPNVPARVRLPLQDVLHTFKRGHRVMVQVQSTWFPLVDRNPGKYVENMFEASEEDFIKTTQRVYRSSSMPSRLEVNVLPR